VTDPLDDAAFLYWIRNRSARSRKALRVSPLFPPRAQPGDRRGTEAQRVGVAGKKWNAIVIRPRIPNGGGIFAEKADARMWLSDDSLRVMLALQSKFSFGR